MTEKFKIINKEEIAFLKFPQTGVLNNVDEIKTRISAIYNTLSLGNLEHSKIKIFFEEIKSKKIIDSTVWGVTDKNVIFKRGVMIPIQRIYKLF